MQSLSEIHRRLPSLFMHSRRKKGFYYIITLTILFKAVFCNYYFNLRRGVARSGFHIEVLKGLKLLFAMWL